VPRVSITWLGSNNPEGPQVKRWNGIDFKINEPVVVPEQLQRAMAKDAEGSKAWKVEVV
jgi:hypothetical protein